MAPMAAIRGVLGDRGRPALRGKDASRRKIVDQGGRGCTRRAFTSRSAGASHPYSAGATNISAPLGLPDSPYISALYLFSERLQIDDSWGAFDNGALPFPGPVFRNRMNLAGRRPSGPQMLVALRGNVWRAAPAERPVRAPIQPFTCL